MTKGTYVLYLVTGKIRKEIYATADAVDAQRRSDVLIAAGLLIELDVVLVAA